MDIFAVRKHDCMHTNLVQHHINPGMSRPSVCGRDTCNKPLNIHANCSAAAEKKLKEMLDAGVIKLADRL